LTKASAVPAAKTNAAAAAPPRREPWPKRLVKAMFGHGRLAGMAVLGAIVLLRILSPTPLLVAQMRGFDLLQQFFPRPPMEQPAVAVVAIDEASLTELGQWPWPRTRLAEIVNRLEEYGAAAIGFDVLFAEADRTSPGMLAESLPNIDPETRARLQAMPSNDDVFAASIQRCCVVLGRAIEEGQAGDAAAAEALPLTPVTTLGNDPLPYARLYRQPRVIAPVETLDAAAQGRGILNLAPEADGVVRRVPLVVSVGERLHPALALELIRVVTGETTFVTRTGAFGIEGVVIGGTLIPTDATGRSWIHFGRADAITQVSARDLLAGTAPPELLGGRIVLVGTTGAGLQNLMATPTHAAMPGVFVHAQFLETLLSGAFLTRPDWMRTIEIASILLLGGLMLWLVPTAGSARTLWLAIGLAAIMASASALCFTQGGLLLDPVLPLATVAVLYGTLVYSNYRREEDQRRWIRSTFARYVSPHYVEQLASNPGMLKLGGDARRMTFLFSDVRGFTSMAERFKSDPAALTRLINRFLTPMAQAIQDHGGTIDKYMGDCVMAFWNAPMPDPEHARHACMAALDMRRRLALLNAELAAEAQAQSSGGEHGDYILAKQLVEGEDTVRDPARAFALFRAEAEQGYANAQYNLAKAYRDGLGTAVDPEAAAQWFLRAARQGHAKAQVRVGTRYAHGEGVRRDPIEALAWFTLAARHGMMEAEAPRRSLLVELTAAQIDEAEHRAQHLEDAPGDMRVFGLEIGIGINTGDCIVGNLGSDLHVNYSVVGDAVNLAARLEGQSRSYGVGIVVGEETVAQAPDLAFLELDLIAVKGKTEAVHIYALLGDEEEAKREQHRTLVARHGEMLAAYRAQRWAEARDAAEACRALAPHLGDLYELYLDRIVHFEINPPGPHWRGVYFATAK
jgi:adenylate cyclase